MSKSKKPWEHAKAAGSESNQLAARFVESLSYDTRMYQQDIYGSRCHARMLQSVGLLSNDELAEIEAGLTEIQQEIEAADVTDWDGWDIDLEDVHMCVEAALIEKVGDAGRKLHTGRSRNDQVAMDLKLWIRDAVAELSEELMQLCRSILVLAERDGEMLLPSYTHLQRAQPVVVGGELMAWLSAMERSRVRLEVLRCVDDMNPLGSGAIAGSSLPLDRFHSAAGIGIGDPTWSSIDATASRDNAVDLVYSLSMISMSLSRWAEQWIIYMTSEFGFLQIGDDYTTGSSMMPQKRNPDMLELIRGRCGNVYGNLMSLLTILKGTPIGYNRDLQEDKRLVFAAYDMVKDCVLMMTGIVQTAEFQGERIAKDIDRGYPDATILAEYLVVKGIPFRSAHQVVGAIVRECIALKVPTISELGLEKMKVHGPVIEADVFDWLGSSNVVERYQSFGNSGMSGFKAQLEHWKGVFAVDELAAVAAMGESELDQGNADQQNILFGDLSESEVIDVMGKAYQAAGRTLDDLPYTEQFEEIYLDLALAGSRKDTWRRLTNLRKRGQLPTGLKAWEQAPVVTDEQQAFLEKVVNEKIGGLTCRDQLPYSPEMDEIVEGYNQSFALNFSPYQVWRVIAKLAK